MSEMNQPPCILFWDINSAHSAKLSSPVFYLTGSKGIKTIFSLFHMNFVDFIAHKSNRVLTCTIQVTPHKPANAPLLCLETSPGISALDLCWKETASCAKLCSMLFGWISFHHRFGWHYQTHFMCGPNQISRQASGVKKPRH